MNYAQTNEGAITAYPFTLAMLKAENPNTGFPRNAFTSAEIRAEYNIVEVVEVAAPESETRNASDADTGRWRLDADLATDCQNNRRTSVRGSQETDC